MINCDIYVSKRLHVKYHCQNPIRILEYGLMYEFTFVKVELQAKSFVGSHIGSS